MLEDVQIISLFFKRSEEAIVELSLKYGKLCNSIAKNILHNREDAKECENDTYFKVWNSIPPDNPENLTAYVCRIARNSALDKLKYYSRQKRSLETDDLFSELIECIPSDDNVQESADDTVIQEVNTFLERLAGQDRVLFIRRYFFGESANSLAKRYGMSPSNVSTKLNRIRRRLKNHLVKEGINI